MIWSDKQLKIFEEYENSSKNICIEACPGGSKTTVLLELLKRTPAFKKSIFLAFNKSIQLELEKRVPEGVETSTLHSLGYRALLKNTSQRYKLNEIKNWILGKQVLKLNIKDSKKQSIYLFIISSLVDLYRLNLCKTKEDLQRVADKYNVATSNGEVDHAIELIEYLETYNSMKHNTPMLIDFVDMLYLPVKLLQDSQFPKYDVVMIDECQDLSFLQWKLVQKIFKKRTRFVSVGDPYQSIYFFQGASLDVFHQIKNYENTTTLPLSYSYRCARSIAAEANTIFNFIESPEGKEEGEVIKKGSLESVAAGDFILCRNNLPLIDTFLWLMKQGKKSIIMGRDYGRGLLNVLNKIEDFEKETIDNLLLTKYNQLKDKGIKNPIKHQSYENLLEQVFILEELHKVYNSISELKNLIEDMFSDKEDKNAITLSTIHKAKGMEADTVYIIGFDELIPSRYATTPEELYAEKCIAYVAVTRSKRKLVFVPLSNL